MSEALDQSISACSYKFQAVYHSKQDSEPAPFTNFSPSNQLQIGFITTSNITEFEPQVHFK